MKVYDITTLTTELKSDNVQYKKFKNKHYILH